MRAALLFLLLATLAHAVVIMPYRPPAGPRHEHHLMVSTAYISRITPEKIARLSLKLHHRNLTHTGPAREAPPDAPDLGLALQHMLDPLYDFLTGVIDMLNQPRAEAHASKRGRPNSMLY